MNFGLPLHLTPDPKVGIWLGDQRPHFWKEVGFFVYGANLVWQGVKSMKWPNGCETDIAAAIRKHLRGWSVGHPKEIAKIIKMCYKKPTKVFWRDSVLSWFTLALLPINWWGGLGYVSSVSWWANSSPLLPFRISSEKRIPSKLPPLFSFPGFPTIRFKSSNFF